MDEFFAAVIEQSDAHKEVPFDAVEYAGRLDRLRAAMSEDKLDLVLLTSPESMFYMTGFQASWYQAQSGRAFPPSSMVAVHVDHDRLIHFDTPSEAVLACIATAASDLRIFPLEERRDGLTYILQELGGEGWLGGTVGLELHNYRPNPAEAGRLIGALEEAGCGCIDATALLRRVRRVKSRAEMDCIIKAAEIADAGVEAARLAIAPGISELEVAGAALQAMAKAGGEPPALPPLVASGFRSNASHALASRKAIAAGERVNIDLSGAWHRYHCNVARSLWCGEPPEEAVAFHDKSIAAFEAIAEILEPGLKVRDLLAAVAACYEEAGIAQHAYWSGGYELGIALAPDWVGEYIYDAGLAGEDDVFEAMTAVNHECLFFAPGASGLSFTIETLIFEEHSARFASKLPREIIACGNANAAQRP